MKILNKFMWVSRLTSQKAWSSYFLNFVNNLVLLSEMRKHSSKISLGMSRAIGFFMDILISG